MLTNKYESLSVICGARETSAGFIASSRLGFFIFRPKNNSHCLLEGTEQRVEVPDKGQGAGGSAEGHPSVFLSKPTRRVSRRPPAQIDPAERL